MSALYKAFLNKLHKMRIYGCNIKENYRSNFPAKAIHQIKKPDSKNTDRLAHTQDGRFIIQLI